MIFLILLSLPFPFLIFKMEFLKKSQRKAEEFWNIKAGGGINFP